MRVFNRISAILPVILLVSVTVFSQVSDPPRKEKQEQISTNESNDEASKTSGLRRISGPNRNWDFDIKIDEHAIEASVEKAVEQAMRSVDAALEALDKLEIHIEPIEVDLKELDLDIDPIKINIPEIRIDIDDIKVDLEHIDLDINDDGDWEHKHHRSHRYDDDDSDKNRKGEKNKSEKEDTQKEKSKGLKKIN